MPWFDTMKISCQALSKDRDRPGRYQDVESLIDMARDLGLDAVDFALFRGFRSREPAYLRAIRQRCDDRGLSIGYVGIGKGFVGARRGTGDSVVGLPLPAEELARRIDEAKEGVDTAALMGVPLLRLFAGGVPEETADRDVLWQSIVACFQAVADHAGEKGITVGLHNHPPAVAPTDADILRLLRDIDRENVTFILDTGQWWGSPGTNLEGRSEPGVDFYGYMEATIAHATCVRTKFYKIDSGREEWLDYERIVPILKQSGYEGDLSIVFEDRGNRCGYIEAIDLAARYLRAAMD